MNSNKKIATITVTLNDHSGLNKMIDYYNGFKDVISHHIIVDNNSDDSFKNKLKEAFPNSILIFRKDNSGTTAGYNDGIKYALEKEVDSIMLIAADIEISSKSIIVLNDTLFSQDNYGIIAPVLLMANSNTIEQFGTDIKSNMMVQRRFYGKNMDDFSKDIIEEVDMLPGGMCLAKSEVYKKVGFQDEDLFMYGDETDYAIRTKNAGYKLIVTSNSKSWHQHIDTENRLHSSGLSLYFINRNILILNYKYNNFFIVLKTFLYLLLFRAPIYSISFIKNGEFNKIKMYLKGLLHGLFKKIDNRINI
jgi:GT2 family glycosyltransferase